MNRALQWRTQVDPLTRVPESVGGAPLSSPALLAAQSLDIKLRNFELRKI